MWLEHKQTHVSGHIAPIFMDLGLYIGTFQNWKQIENIWLIPEKYC